MHKLVWAYRVIAVLLPEYVNSWSLCFYRYVFNSVLFKSNVTQLLSLNAGMEKFDTSRIYSMVGHKILLNEKNLETVKKKYYNFEGFAFPASLRETDKKFYRCCAQCSFRWLRRDFWGSLFSQHNNLLQNQQQVVVATGKLPSLCRDESMMLS